MHNGRAESRILKTGHFAGLRFKQGWFFIHVLETEELELKPWTLMNENDNRDVIASETAGSKDDEFQDEIERHLINPSDNEENLVFQMHFGVAPSRMQIYPIFGRDRSPNLEEATEPGEPHHWITGADSPYNNPTNQAELFTVKDASQVSLQAYNPMPEPREARLSIHINKIRYAVVDDEDLMKSFIQGKTPFRDHTMGLGAQEGDQIKAPSWIMSKYGDQVKTTQEILSRTPSPSPSPTPSNPGNNSPDTGSGTPNTGGDGSSDDDGRDLPGGDFL